MPPVLTAERNRPVIKSYQELGEEAFGASFSGDQVVTEMTKNLYKSMGIHRRFENEEAFENAFSNISKALGTTSLGSLGDATPLRLENLDDVMTSVLITEEHLVLWNWLQRKVSMQPIFEYNRRLRWGGGRRTPGFQEGGVPKGSTGAWERKVATNRYMGVKRGITHQALTTSLLGGAQVDLAAEEERGGTIDLLTLIERWLIWGNQDFKSAGGPTLSYDGLIQQMLNAQTAHEIDSRNIIDMKGQPLTYDHIEIASKDMFKIGKLASMANCQLFMPPDVSSDLSLQKLPAERATLLQEGSGNGRYITGVPIVGMKTGRGDLYFKDSILLEEVDDNNPLTNADDVEPTAPAAPATVSAAEASYADGTFSGTFYWSASAFNDGGESIITVDTSSQAITTAHKGTITISRVNDAHGYRVYRGLQSDGSDAKLVGSVAQPSTGDASFDDTNSQIPGTYNCFLLNNEVENLMIAQMAPLIKFPLGIVSTTIEFLLLLYHVLILKSAKRQIWFTNVGRYTTHDA